MKSSKPIAPIPSGSIEQMFRDKGLPEGTAAHQFFSIQDWREAGDIIMKHIPVILNPSDDMTKPLGWVLHARHCRRIMGHYG